MQIFNASLLLSLFAAAITRSVDASSTRRYIIMHNDTTDPLENLGDTSVAELTPLLEAENHVWCTANLTPEDVETVSHTLNGSGIIVPDDIIELPFEDTGIARRLRSTTSISDTTEYLTDYPQCKAHVDDVDVFVLDTVIYSNLANFAGFDLENVKSYVDANPTEPKPCNPHGTEVTSVIIGNNNGVINSGNIRVRGVGIFDCNGRGFISNMIAGIQDALDHDAENKAAAQGTVLRRTLINISGVGPTNQALNAAVTAVYKKGIPIFVAAGNANLFACNSQSPAQAQGALAIGATTNGDKLALFSNYGLPCVPLYLPGNPVTVVNPNGNKVPASGTSFGSPLAAAEGAMELALNPQATPDQVYARILNRSMTVNLPAGSAVSSMQVLTKDSACPQPQLLSSYTTTKADNNKFLSWKALNSNTSLCFRFDAEFMTKSGYVLIGLRNNATSTSITLGKFQFKKHFLHRIQEADHSQKTTTNTRIINQKTSTTIAVAQQDGKLLVHYYNSSARKPLISTVDRNQYSQVSFSAGGNAKVHYTNAVAC